MKHELIASLQKCEVVESEELDRRAQIITRYEQSVIKDNELLFKKFKDSNEFGQERQEIKRTAYFKIKLVKRLNKYPKIKSSSLSLIFFKKYAKIIKEVCKESGNQFK